MTKKTLVSARSVCSTYENRFHRYFSDVASFFASYILRRCAETGEQYENTNRKSDFIFFRRFYAYYKHISSCRPLLNSLSISISIELFNFRISHVYTIESEGEIIE